MKANQSSFRRIRCLSECTNRLVGDENIDRFFCGELGFEELLVFNKHLEGCAACRQQVRAISYLLQFADSNPSYFESFLKNATGRTRQIPLVKNS